jgi:hypothetical protein
MIKKSATVYKENALKANNTTEARKDPKKLPVTGNIEAGVALLPTAAGVVLFKMVRGELI